MILKEFAKIGKSILRQLSSSVDYYQLSEEVHDIDSNEGTAPELTYSIHHWRLSKLQILQFILYHFYQIDERGVIRGVSEKAIAEEIGCTVRTVRNNNLLFEKIGLIYYANGSNGINIQLVDYPRYFEEAGSGYMEFGFPFFENLKTIEEVNALRVEIRKEYIYDNHEVRRLYKKDSTPCRISFHDLKMTLPKYTHYKAMIQKIVEKGSGTFKTVVDGSDIVFTLEEGLLSRKQQKEHTKNEYIEFLRQFISKYECASFIGEQDLNDFVQLALEYSLNRLLPALEEFLTKEFLIGDQEPTLNYGGRVRTLIRIHLAQKTTSQLLGA